MRVRVSVSESESKTKINNKRERERRTETKKNYIPRVRNPAMLTNTPIALKHKRNSPTE